MSERSLLVRALPCEACAIEKQAQPFPSEEHHFNLGSYAGKARRGDEYSCALCGHHHRGLLLPGFTVKRMEELYGPSLVHARRRFHECYGTDDQLLERTNQHLGIAE